MQNIIEFAQLVSAKAKPLRLSRLTQSRGPPRCADSRRNGSSGVSSLRQSKPGIGSAVMQDGWGAIVHSGTLQTCRLPQRGHSRPG